MAYRSTNHVTTGVSPAKLMFNREMVTKLPDISLSDAREEEREGYGLQKLLDRDAETKQLTKDYADERRHARDKDLRVGDKVLLEKKRENKLSQSYESQPYSVVDKNGDQVVIRSPQGVEYKRNVTHVKKMENQEPQALSSEQPPVANEEDRGESSVHEKNGSQASPTEGPVVHRRSGRIKQLPKSLLQDYVLN